MGDGRSNHKKTTATAFMVAVRPTRPALGERSGAASPGPAEKVIHRLLRATMPALLAAVRAQKHSEAAARAGRSWFGLAPWPRALRDACGSRSEREPHRLLRDHARAAPPRQRLKSPATSTATPRRRSPERAARSWLATLRASWRDGPFVCGGRGDLGGCSWRPPL